MAAREQLLNEIAQTPDVLLEEVLDFLLFAKARRTQQVSEQKKSPRPFALCAGEFTVPPNFNAPLPDEILRDFES
ncbi:MAG: hypothetical protein CLLPBCKN_003579 [Chroococcidiopsis cubana SAG 39.79]|uniref:DUF2281 domain-containing protein n=1 Tax=Chroococcidiopsis cubana SAG 39.79 TaxID=388085 RepID=A0AB37UDZ2_9CYAN|nr:DUF2281 domain-containing protein [Chroococcidiopsis cubana]MDZ4874183.1 hypothetical protein [Chroococcidiopsis cubana SAG 39.79]PSB62261.1 DUF2281 domain-containing protein [Chroococcidiopsis cubana CCALA 043]RUT06275.1 hypothetical protein DSM107010_53330 [Chroococcidiopsis cubana SAG 39.79]